MPEVQDRVFGSGDSVHVDGATFVRCTFDNASLIYSGGRHPDFQDCTLENVGWQFEGEALRTIQMLQALGSSPNGKFFIEDLFEPGKVLASDLQQGLTSTFAR